MELNRTRRYPLHGRVQVALSKNEVVAGRAFDIALGGIGVILDERIACGQSYTLRFELWVKEKMHLVTTVASASYGVFASQGGFRVGFVFAGDDPQRDALIEALAGKKPVAEPAAATLDAAPNEPPLPEKET